MDDYIKQPDAHRWQSWEYDSHRRFLSYWYQIHETMILHPSHVLEVGVGSGFVSEYLRKRNVRITTYDIDGHLKPDVVGSICRMPFGDSTFDVITACEVLEHLPFEETKTALRELYRVTSHWVIFSVPDITRSFRIEIPIPWRGKFKRFYTVPVRKPHSNKVDSIRGHYWEIGTKEYPLSKVMAAITEARFLLSRHYRMVEHPAHHFFILEKH